MFPFLFQLLETVHILWLRGLFLYHQSQHCYISLCLTFVVTFSFDPDTSVSLFYFKHPCDCTGLTQINKNNLPILRSAATLTPFLLCNITLLQDHIFVEALFCSSQKGLEKSYLCLNSSLGPENSCLALILPFLLLFNKILEVRATVIK